MVFNRQGLRFILFATSLVFMLGISNTIAVGQIDLNSNRIEAFQTASSPIEVWVSLSGCYPVEDYFSCPDLPQLVFSVGPFDAHQVRTLRIFFEGPDYSCSNSTCIVQTDLTSEAGRKLEFWAILADGTTTRHYTARIRVIEFGSLSGEGGEGYRVDLVSSQLKNDPGMCCSNYWEALPPLDNPPLWVTTPESVEDLSSEERLYFLAGQMIRAGLVDASLCPNGGFRTFNYASECGMDLAWGDVQTWQNRFDEEILAAASSTGVPAWLLKKLFIQESQMWPGDYYDAAYNIQHYGLGHLTPLGADTLLLWNPEFYRRFCIENIRVDPIDCSVGYALLDADERALIRTRLAQMASAECPNCLYGLNLFNIDYSIEIFAETLRANAAQVSQIFWITTQVAPGTLTSYEDMWRFTIANYNVGPVCLYNAIMAAKQENQSLDWAGVSSYFGESCIGAINYVHEITGN